MNGIRQIAIAASVGKNIFLGKKMRNISILVSVACLGVLLAGCGDKADATQQTKTAQPIEQQLPKHFYALKDGIEYGYEQALSEQDRNEGRAAKSLLMFSYLGRKGDIYQVMLKENNIRTVAECSMPCEYAKVYTFLDTQFLKKDTLRISPQVIVASVLADAMQGNLEQMTGMQSGVKTTFWVDGEKKRLVVADASTSGVGK
jgi:hypothetical protein